MTLKFKHLIGFAVIVLLGLCAIQYYLVATTYHYKVAQFQSEIKEKLANSTNNFTSFDTTLLDKKEAFYQNIAVNYLLDKNYRWKLKKQFAENDFQKDYTQLLKTAFEKDFPDDSLHFAVLTSKFILVNNNIADTIFSEKASIENKLFGNLKSLNNAFLVRNYVNTSSIKRENAEYKLLVEATIYVSINNWQTIVYKRMALVLLFAVGSVLVVLLVFIYTLRIALKQKKLSEIKTDFINNITHELKTPLTTLAVSTAILNRKEILETPKLHRNAILTIHRQVQRLETIVDQVVQKSVTEEQILLHKKLVFLPKYLENIASDFRLSHPNISLNLQNTIHKSLCLDPFYLTTAIANVLENAVKYGADTITITTNYKLNELEISISDNGIGIHKNHQKLLFQKFYRVQSYNIHTVKGLGLGLYYVQQIMKAHQGNVHLWSELGKGSTFVLSIAKN